MKVEAEGKVGAKVKEEFKAEAGTPFGPFRSVFDIFDIEVETGADRDVLGLGV